MKKQLTGFQNTKIIQKINKISEECPRGHSLTTCNDELDAMLPRSVFFSIESKSGLYLKKL